jgi:hypothetical protein
MPNAGNSASIEIATIDIKSATRSVNSWDEIFDCCMGSGAFIMQIQLFVRDGDPIKIKTSELAFYRAVL